MDLIVEHRTRRLATLLADIHALKSRLREAEREAREGSLVAIDSIPATRDRYLHVLELYVTESEALRAITDNARKAEYQRQVRELAGAR